ncbi:MAG TPA: 5'-methylthioadenosine/S-adenosylhomocysteine nucleosidase [Streptosporangiaceae bacterium]
MSFVVVLTALDLEYQAVRQYLDGLQAWSHPAGTLFEVGQLPGGVGTVAMAVTGVGNVGAAVLAERAIAMFAPQALICVGVAGGLRSNIALGDVVVATKVYALHDGRVHDDGFVARPRAWHASHELEQVAKFVARTGTWTNSIASGPGLGPLVVQPTVHFGPVVSGEVVVSGRDESVTGRLRDVFDDAVAVEMESAGIAHAAHLNRALPVLTVRGISDHADSAKYANDAAGWQHVAANHAAAFTVAALTKALCHQPGVWPRTQLPVPLVSRQRQLASAFEFGAPRQ